MDSDSSSERPKYKLTTAYAREFSAQLHFVLARALLTIAKFLAQVFEPIQVQLFALLRQPWISSNTACHATAMKCQLAGQLVTAHASAPSGKPLRRKRAP